jgi:hypothetical protein
MSTQSELARFHAFLKELLAQADRHVSPEEALEEWRRKESLAEDYEAVREALAAMEAGDIGMPIEDFDRQIRAKHGLPPRR